MLVEFDNFYYDDDDDEPSKTATVDQNHYTTMLHNERFGFIHTQTGDIYYTVNNCWS